MSAENARVVNAKLIEPERAESGAAPMRVVLELWPDVPKARAEVTRDGKTEDYELKASMVLSVILSYLKGLKK